MANFGGFEIETPQEVIQRIREQREKSSQNRDPFFRRKANIDSAIDVIFGNPEARRQKRVTDAVKSAQSTFEEDEEASDLRNEVNRLKSMRDAVEDIDPQTATQLNQRILELAVAEEEQSRLKAESDAKIDVARQDIKESNAGITAQTDEIALAGRAATLAELKESKPTDVFVVAQDENGTEFTMRADDPRLDNPGTVVLGTADTVFTARHKAKGKGEKFSDSQLKEFEDLGQKTTDLRAMAEFDLTQTGPIEGRIDAVMEFFGVDTDTTDFNTRAGQLKLSAQSALKGVPSDKDQQILDNVLPGRDLSEPVNRSRITLQIKAAQAGVRYKIAEAMSNQGRIPSSLMDAARNVGVQPMTVGTVEEELRRVNSVLDQVDKTEQLGDGKDGETVDPTPASEISTDMNKAIEEAGKPLATARGGSVIIS